MKLGELAVSRQGKLVVINHQKYKIEFNLQKGTWNYKDATGQTIIKNGYTQVSLEDGTTLKTSDAGLREFQTELPATDAFGTHQTVRFSYEPTKGRGKRQNSSPTNRTTTDKIGIRVYTYLTCYGDHPYILLKVCVENLKQAPIRVTSITLIDISAQQGTVQVGGHPSQYHLFLKTPPISANENYQKIYDGFCLSQDNLPIQPYHNGLLHDTDSKKAFVFGFLTTERWWPHIQIGYQAPKRKSPQGLTAWALYHNCERYACQAGEQVTSEIGYLDFSEDAASIYTRYLERVATENIGQTLPSAPEQHPSDTALGKHSARSVFTGWNFSSENIEGELSAQLIKEQTQAIAKNPLFKPTVTGEDVYIHLDIGWQTDPGDLTLNRDHFPEGMLPVVEHIHACGFKAGICIDPFEVAHNSAWVQKQPAACLQTGDKPAEVHLPHKGQAVAILDVSHPAAQTHVREMIRCIIDEWEYDLIKVDLSSYTNGMMSIAAQTNWHDSSLTSTELYRLAVRLLQEAVDETEGHGVLAGYNLIESGSIGTFAINYPMPRQRGSYQSDMWHQQNGVKHRLSRYASHLSAHNTLWHYVYGELTVDEPRPINEAIVEMTAAALSGAATLYADTPTALSPNRAELVAKLLPLCGNAANPIDRYDEPFPKIWHLPVETPREAWHLAAVFNWKDQQDDVHLNLDTLGLNPDKDYLVHDFWMRQYLGVVSKNVTLLNIAPRSAKLLCFREEQNVPQLLATDMHYTQGSVEILSAGWDCHSQSYLLIIKPPRQASGTCFIHVPEDYLPINVSAYGGNYEYSWEKPIYQLTFSPTETLVHASVQFTKTTGSTQQT